MRPRAHASVYGQSCNLGGSVAGRCKLAAGATSPCVPRGTLRITAFQRASGSTRSSFSVRLNETPSKSRTLKANIDLCERVPCLTLNLRADSVSIAPHTPEWMFRAEQFAGGRYSGSGGGHHYMLEGCPRCLFLNHDPVDMQCVPRGTPRKRPWPDPLCNSLTANWTLRHDATDTHSTPPTLAR